MTDYSGQSTGRYHIIEKLGQGGMAVVYKAYDTSLDIDVAIKFIRTERLTPEATDKARKRFKIEAQKTAKLMHPNIIPVIDYGEFQGIPFLVMRYIEGGKNLKSMLGKPIPWQEAIKIILPIAEALDFAHKNQIVHRDVKPSNILITDDGTPLLSDFGIAKVIEDEETMDGLTSAGLAIGTPEYMAPEQWEGKTVDGRADIYALGVILYEMITGRPPFKADTVPAVMVQVLRDPLPRPKQFVPDLPKEIEKIIIRMLARQPEERISSILPVLNPSEGLSFKLENHFRIKNKVAPHLTHKTTKILGGVFLCVIIAVLIISTLIPNINTKNNQTDTSEKNLAIKTRTSKKDGMPMVFIPAGEFLMGSPDNSGRVDEQPQHQVFLDDYWIDQLEVTNNMFAHFVEETGYKTFAEIHGFSWFTDGKQLLSKNGINWFHPKSPSAGISILGDFPVVHVTKDDAAEYCAWAGKKLPTEAQWEKAARGIDGRVYPWGNTPPDETYANYGNNLSNSSVAGQFVKGASPYGAYDMAGNVWEWTNDWYSATYYSQGDIRNPTGPQTGLGWVLKGGAWHNDPFSIRISMRKWDGTGGISFSENDIGFRCVSDTE